MFYPFFEHDSKAVQDSFPVSNGHRPFFADVSEGQIEGLEQRLVARKRAAVLGGLAQNHVH